MRAGLEVIHLYRHLEVARRLLYRLWRATMLLMIFHNIPENLVSHARRSAVYVICEMMGPLFGGKLATRLPVT